MQQYQSSQYEETAHFFIETKKHSIFFPEKQNGK